MHLKYLHYFGNESSKSLLEAYGIVTTEPQLWNQLKPKQCPNCSEPNKPDSRFCVSCHMIPSYDTYTETLEAGKLRESELKLLQEKHESDMKQIHEDVEAILNKILAKIDPSKLD
jgi:hypothetical protein